MLVREPEPLAAKVRKEEATQAPLDGWRLLTAPAILLNLVFFILLSFCGGGLNNYLVALLGALYGTPVTVANTALTSLLIMSAVGVLVGGILTGWTMRHGLVASVGLMPSRDMIVRAVTPPGAYGRVFGFVSSGFNIAGILAPIIFGQLLDHGRAREVFFFMAACALASILTVAISTSRKRAD
jgi:MFS family permease